MARQTEDRPNAEGHTYFVRHWHRTAQYCWQDSDVAPNPQSNEGLFGMEANSLFEPGIVF